MPDPQKVVEVLRAALAKMNDSGAHWTRRTLFRRNDQNEEMFCSLGAIFEVTGMPVAQYVELQEQDDCDTTEEIVALYDQGDKETRRAAVWALAQAVPKPVWQAHPDDENGVFNVITYWNDRQASGWSEIRAVFAKAEQIAEQGAPGEEKT